MAGDNIRDRFAALSGKVRLGGAQVGRKMGVSLVSVSEKMKELMGVSSPVDKLVEELTDEGLEAFDWSKSLELCHSINQDKMNGQEVVRALKKRIALKNARVQLLCLTLLDACVKNCQKILADVASERLLDEMVKIIDDHETPIVNRDRALKLVMAWGERTDELRHLPMFEETYKSLKSRGVKFPTRALESLIPVFAIPASATPPAESNDTLQELDTETPPGAHGEYMGIAEARETFQVARNCIELLSTVLTSSPQQEVLQDDLTVTLVDQCRQLQFAVHEVVEQAGDNESFLFDALTVNDELQKVLGKFEEMSTTTTSELLQPNQSSLQSVQLVSDSKDELHGSEDDVSQTHNVGHDFQ